MYFYYHENLIQESFVWLAIDGQDGKSNNNPDRITIPYCYRSNEKKVIVRPSTEINNLDKSRGGNFDYIILPDKGEANINIEPDYTFTQQRKHNFLFNYTLFDLASVNIENIKDINHWYAGYGNMTHTIRNVTFSFLSPSLKDKSINEKFDITISDIPANASYILSDNTEIKIGKNNLYAMHSTDKTIDEVVQSYPTVADHLRMSLFVSTNNETVVMGHGNHDIINNNFLQKSHLIGSGGENVYVVTSGHEILDIENLPIPEVIVYDDFNKENSLKDILDLRQLVRQVNGDLSIEPISKIIEDRNDLLIKLSISATALKQDVITVRLKDAFVNNWYKELQVILNNAPMKISSELELKPLPLIFDKNKEVIVVTPQDVEEKSELIISKEAGQYTFLYSGYDLMITNILDADMEKNKFCTICLKDFYKQPKMETLSIRFNDTEILLSNEIDKINNADSISDKLNMNGYVSSIVKLQESSAPLETASSNHPIRHKRHKDHSRHGDGVYRTRHKHHRVQKRNINYQDSHYYIGQSEISTNSAAKPSSWINSCISWMKKLAASTFSIIPGLPAQYNIADKNDNINVKGDNNNIPQSISSVGWNNFLNNENIALASCVADALDNTPSRRYQNSISKGVEVVPSRKVAVEFALRKFDSFVEGKIRNLDSKEQARIRVELKDVYPEIIASLERGVEFSGNVGLDDVLEKCKECFYENILPSNSKQEAPGFKQKRQSNNALNIKNEKETQKTVNNEIANKGDSFHAVSCSSSADVHETDQDCRGLGNLIEGEAIANGSCFFDSFRQGLEQQKGIKVTVEQLRNDCKGFAQDNPPEWFKTAINNDFDEDKGRLVNRGINCSQYINRIEGNEFWGRPDIEGKILCGKYGVKLHVVESNPLHVADNQQDQFLHQLIDNADSKSVDQYNVDCDDNGVLHIINKGGNHFRPLLDRNKSLTKQVRGYLSVSEPQDETIYDLPRSNMNEIIVNQHQASTIPIEVSF